MFDTVQPGDSLDTPGLSLRIPEVGGAAGTYPYIIQRGDTFYRIAQRYGVNAQALAAANPQLEDPALLQPGQVLYIPRRLEQQYVVQPGETLHKIALSFGVTVDQLVSANPGTSPTQLRTGQMLIIPRGARQAIVNPREDYGFDEMMEDLTALAQRYPFIQLSTIGRSVIGRPIAAVRIGTGARQVHYNASFHANEWITTPLLMKFIEVYADAIERGQPIRNYDVPRLFRESSLWLVPMVNPDGVELVQEGIDPSNPYFEEVLRINGGSRDFRRWSANIRGVDLNHQFPANWEREAAISPKRPAPMHYSGTAPLTEPEARAMADFTRAHNFRLVLAYHSQGEVIYWGYEGLEPPESQQIAALFARVSGYAPIRGAGSWAGYRDWFIQDWRRPGFTIEVGRGVNPLPISQFGSIWEKNLGILLSALAV